MQSSNYLALLTWRFKNGFESVPIPPCPSALQKNGPLPNHTGACKSRHVNGLRRPSHEGAVPSPALRARSRHLRQTVETWLDACRQNVGRGDRTVFRQNLIRITNDFQQVEVTEEKRIRVGLSARFWSNTTLPQITGWRNFWNAWRRADRSRSDGLLPVLRSCKGIQTRYLTAE